MIMSQTRFTRLLMLTLGVLAVMALSAPSKATPTNPLLAEKIYRAIAHSQTQDPNSYFSSFEGQPPGLMATSSALSKPELAPDQQCTGVPTMGMVYGSTTLDGAPLDYEIDFHDLVVKAHYLDKTHLLAAKDLVDFQSKEGWPCAVPVAAVVCAISGGAFCGWRIAQCYKAAERCPCGVAVYNCGVCGEGSGVRCSECLPPKPIPDLKPIFRWPIVGDY